MTQLNSSATPFIAGAGRSNLTGLHPLQVPGGLPGNNDSVAHNSALFRHSGGLGQFSGQGQQFALLEQQLAYNNHSTYLAQAPQQAHSPGSFQHPTGVSSPPSPLPSAYAYSPHFANQYHPAAPLQQFQQQQLHNQHHHGGSDRTMGHHAALLGHQGVISAGTGWPESGVLPSLSQSPMIRDVWAQNLEEEFAIIRSLLSDYSYVAMDTEFPGVVAKAVGSFKSPTEFYYQTLKVNVNMLKMIQVGMTLLNERGEVPEHCCTWQFNFSFALEKDTYAIESIDLLTQGGIDFKYFSAFGIDMNHFAALLISSGMVRNPDVHWLAFHSGYDFGYLTKVLFGADLPDSQEEFMRRFHLLFPTAYDLKYLLRKTDYSHSFGLDYLAEVLKVKRCGNAHQAGSDSLLTGHCFFRLMSECFKSSKPKHGNGILYGLTEDTAAIEGTAASADNNAAHHFGSSSATGIAVGGPAAADTNSSHHGHRK